MNKEKQLLSKAIAERNIGLLLERGVNGEWFKAEDDKRIFSFLQTHYSKYAESPSIEILLESFPTYKETPSEDVIDYLIDAVRDLRRKEHVQVMLQGSVSAIGLDDHELALEVIQKSLVRIEEDHLNESNDVEITDNPDQRYNDYLSRKEKGTGILGYPTGFYTIDRSTMGLQNGQLVVIVATPKTGKSTLALQMALNIHRSEGVTPMFYSFEMSNKEQQLRYDAMRAHVSHQRLMTGTLTQEEEGRYRGILNRMKDNEPKFWFTDSASGVTLSQVIAKVQVHKPEILFIDGMYLMVDEQTGEANTPQALTGLTRGLKRMAQKFDIPVIITTQALDWKKKNGKLTANSIGYSSSFFQDADIVFGLEKDDEEDDTTRTLRVLGARNSGAAEASLTWLWNEGLFKETTEGEDL